MPEITQISKVEGKLIMKSKRNFLNVFKVFCLFTKEIISLYLFNHFSDFSNFMEEIGQLIIYIRFLKMHSKFDQILVKILRFQRLIALLHRNNYKNNKLNQKKICNLSLNFTKNIVRSMHKNLLRVKKRRIRLKRNNKNTR